jgi:anti-sigma factor ChrR (cupin superfamily)
MNDRKRIPIAELHELASLYALGALDGHDKVAFEEHLRQGCDACAKDVNAFADVASLLGESVSAAPPAGLGQRVLSSIRQGPRSPGILFEQGGLLIARSDEMSWQDIAPGIAYKPLFEDSVRKYNTALVRMDAGARYPSHRHAAVEELFMLSGDLHMENQVMRAGDYCRADSNSLHRETFSETGCLFFVMVSPENQIIAAVGS